MVNYYALLTIVGFVNEITYIYLRLEQRNLNCRFKSACKLIDKILET